MGKPFGAADVFGADKVKGVGGADTEDGDVHVPVGDGNSFLLSLEHHDIVVVGADVELGQGLDEAADGGFVGVHFDDVDGAVEFDAELLALLFLADHQLVFGAEPVGRKRAIAARAPEA